MRTDFDGGGTTGIGGGQGLLPNPGLASKAAAGWSQANSSLKLDIRSEVVSGEIAMNNTFVPRHVSQKFGLNGGGVSIVQPERQSDGGWSHV